MADITLIQQAENSSNGTTSCSLTLENCTVGNTLILAYAIRGSGNNPTLSDGWEKIGGGNKDANPDLVHKLYFAKKKVENTTETITLIQTTTGRIYLVCGEFSGDFDIIMRDDMANIGSRDYKVTANKKNTTDVILYGVTSSYYPTGRGQKCEPNDLTKLQGNDTAERLACWFDNGNGAVSHTFKTSTDSGSDLIAIVECVQLIAKKSKKPKYLIRNNDIVYTVQNDALVEVVGDLNAQLFIDNGVDDIPSGTLLMTLSKPELLCWEDTEKDLPKLTATVTATPVGQYITKVIDMSNASISGINNVTVECTGTPWFSCSFDGGITWMEYSGGTWIEVELYGMAKETLISITSDEWYSATSGVDRFIMRVLLRSSSDSLTNLSVNFLNVTT